MSIALNITLAIAFSIVVYQDLKMRLIHLVLPIIILSLGIAIKWTTLNWVDSGLCFVFLLLNLLVIVFYFSIKNRKLINPFQSMVGWGDALFLIAIVPYFSLRNYIIFFVLGMIFSLIVHTVLRLLFPVEKSIPLAGYLSLFILGIIGINFFLENDFLQ